MSKKPLLIGFTGSAGSGKSTAAEYFEKTHRLQRESFAKKMKEGLAHMLNLPKDSVFGDKDQKEAAIPKLSTRRPISGRLLLQTLGTEWGRDTIDPDIWLYAVADKWDVMKGIPGFSGMVIEDVRFENEAKWIRDQGGVIIRINTPAQLVRQDVLNHSSESGIPAKYVSVEMTNWKGTKEKFYHDLARLHTLLTGEPVQKDEKVESIKDLITNWANEVFPDRTITNALQKMVMEEIPEYMMNQNDKFELADIGILLYDIAYLAGIDLDEAIREKMAINKSRKWQIIPETGLMKHIKEEYL